MNVQEVGGQEEGEGAPGGGDRPGAGAMDEGESQVAQGRQDLRGVAVAQARAARASGHVAHRVPPVLDVPMGAHQLSRVRRAWNRQFADLYRFRARFGEKRGTHRGVDRHSKASAKAG